MRHGSGKITLIHKRARQQGVEPVIIRRMFQRLSQTGLRIMHLFSHKQDTGKVKKVTGRTP